MACFCREWCEQNNVLAFQDAALMWRLPSGDRVPRTAASPSTKALASGCWTKIGAPEAPWARGPATRPECGHRVLLAAFASSAFVVASAMSWSTCSLVMPRSRQESQKGVTLIVPSLVDAR